MDSILHSRLLQVFEEHPQSGAKGHCHWVKQSLVATAPSPYTIRWRIDFLSESEIRGAYTAGDRDILTFHMTGKECFFLEVTDDRVPAEGLVQWKMPKGTDAYLQFGADFSVYTFPGRLPYMDLDQAPGDFWQTFSKVFDADFHSDPYQPSLGWRYVEWALPWAGVKCRISREGALMTLRPFAPDTGSWPSFGFGTWIIHVRPHECTWTDKGAVMRQQMPGGGLAELIITKQSNFHLEIVLPQAT